MVKKSGPDWASTEIQFNAGFVGHSNKIGSGKELRNGLEHLLGTRIGVHPLMEHGHTSHLRSIVFRRIARAPRTGGTST